MGVVTRGVGGVQLLKGLWARGEGGVRGRFSADNGVGARGLGEFWRLSSGDLGGARL